MPGVEAPRHLIIKAVEKVENQPAFGKNKFSGAERFVCRSRLADRLWRKELLTLPGALATVTQQIRRQTGLSTGNRTVLFP